MTIGIFTDYYAPSVGGTETAVANYKQALEQLGHRVYLFCPRYRSATLAEEGDDIVRLPVLPWVRFNGSPLLFMSPWLKYRCGRYQLDVVHSMTPFASTILATQVARLLQKPHVTTLHTLIPNQVEAMPFPRMTSRLLVLYGLLVSAGSGEWLWWRRFFVSRQHSSLTWRYLLTMLKAATVTTVATQALDVRLRQQGFTQDTARLPMFSTIPTTITKSDVYINRLLQSIAGKLTITTSGRLAPEKRLNVLIEAVSRLPAELDWCVVIAGEGPERTRLEKQVTKHDLSDRVLFTGNLSQDQLAQLLRASDIYALVSYRFDTQGIVLLDAARHGLPIVYCDDYLDVGVNSRNSILCRPDAASIAEAVSLLATDTARRQRMSQASVAIAATLTPGLLAQQLVAIYQRLVRSSQANRNRPVHEGIVQ